MLACYSVWCHFPGLCGILQLWAGVRFEPVIFTRMEEGITMTSRSIMRGLAAALALLAGTPAQADTTLGIQGSDGLNTSIQIRNGKGRIGSVGREDYLLYDSATKLITYVEPDHQQYTQVTEAELVAMVQTAASVKETVAPYMEDMLAGLPAEQRIMVEQRMGAMLGTPAAGKPVTPVDIRIVKQGQQTIAGLQCQASNLLKNGQSVAEICMATSASGKLSPEDFSTLETLVKVSRSMAGKASSILDGMDEQASLLAVELEGVPVNVRDTVNGKYYQVTEVSSVALPDTLFSGYENFKKQGIQNLLR